MSTPKLNRLDFTACLRWDAAAAGAGEQNARDLAELARCREVIAGAREYEGRVGSVGICGAGVMGTGIAEITVRHGIPVRIHDAAPAAVQRAVARLRDGLSADASGQPARLEGGVAALLAAGPREEAWDACDLVIESVVENRELKQRVLNELAGCLHPGAVLATNTSTLSVGQLSAPLPHPTRFCGLHFCSPVSERQLVEIIRSPATSCETVSLAAAYVRRIGKLPIVVPDTPGFLVNRLLLPYLNESLQLLLEGADPVQVDGAARGFGMALGPLELFDVIGMDTAVWAGRCLWEAYPDRVALTPLLPALAKRGRLGCKAGLGFYRYVSSSDRGEVDPDLSAILRPYVRTQRQFSDEEIVFRLLLPMLLEATRALEEQIVRDVRDVDIALLFGLAFPASRGGLLFWADHLGVAAVLELLAPWESLGPRMRPTSLLREMARTGQRFYHGGVAEC